jgi:phosphopantetheinyl transferase (holo-ACP synthase)
MTIFVSSTDVLTQDPEAFELYFAVTDKESRQYQQHIEKINSFWKDWPLKEAKNEAARTELNANLKRR